MTQNQPVDKAYLTGVTLSIGILSTVGNIHTITVTNAGKGETLHSVCPTCRAPKQFLSQKLVCNDNDAHGPFGKGEVRMGSKVADKIVIVDGDKATAARKSVLPERELALQVHRREDVEPHTFPKGNAHVFVPVGNGAFYGILVELLKKRRDLVLIAKTNLSKTDHLIVVDVEMNDQLVLREMLWPEDMKTFAAPEYENNPKLTAQAETLLDALVEDFVPAEYKKDSRDRIAAVIDEATKTKVTKTKRPSKKVDDTDLAALIEAAIADREKAA